ncbi:MAG: hypothetical protein ACHQ9S_01580 [Candidatus Binatia bacterium]
MEGETGIFTFRLSIEVGIFLIVEASVWTLIGDQPRWLLSLTVAVGTLALAASRLEEWLSRRPANSWAKPVRVLYYSTAGLFVGVVAYAAVRDQWPLILDAGQKIYERFHSASSPFPIQFYDAGHGADSATIKDVTPAFPWKSLAEAGALFVVAAASILVIVRRCKLGTGASQPLSQSASAPPTFIDVHLGPTISTGVYGVNKSDVPIAKYRLTDAAAVSAALPPASVSERDVAKDACARLVRTAIAACTTLLDSPSRATAAAVGEQFEHLSKFWEIHGGLLDDEERNQLSAGLLHLGAAVEDTAISVDPTNLQWQRSVRFFLAAMERIAPSPAAPPSMRMDVLYANVHLMGLGPNRLIKTELMVQFHNTSSQPLTVYGIATSVADGITEIKPAADPLANNPESINVTRVRVRNQSNREAVDMTRGIQVAAGSASDIYVWETPALLPLSAYPKDAKLRVKLSAMNQADCWEDIPFPWHLLLEKIILTLKPREW